MKYLAIALLLSTSALLLFSHPSAARSKLGIAGRYHCECMSGDTVVAGTCSTAANGSGGISCGKHTGDTCTATCKMVTFTKGVTGETMMKKSQ